jgi:hypothetical protein
MTPPPVAVGVFPPSPAVVFVVDTDVGDDTEHESTNNEMKVTH